MAREAPDSLNLRVHCRINRMKAPIFNTGKPHPGARAIGTRDYAGFSVFLEPAEHCANRANQILGTRQIGSLLNLFAHIPCG